MDQRMLKIQKEFQQGQDRHQQEQHRLQKGQSTLQQDQDTIREGQLTLHQGQEEMMAFMQHDTERLLAMQLSSLDSQFPFLMPTYQQMAKRQSNKMAIAYGGNDSGTGGLEQSLVLKQGK
jgi:hypothetical protein